MEERISKFAAALFGGSLIIAVMFLIVMVAFFALVSGNYDQLRSPVLVQSFVIAVFYILAVYLVASLPGKKIERRLASWVFSILFHVVLLVYLSIQFDLGMGVMVVGFIETAIIALSIAGLGSLLNEHYGGDV